MKLGILGRGALAALVLAVGSAITAPPALAAPGTDNIAAAANLALPSTITGNTTGATLEVGEPQPNCLASGDTTGSTVWYRFRLTQPATVIASTFGSKIDTTLAVFTGSARMNRLTPVGCNDDAEDVGSLQSRLRIPATAGPFYFIQVGGLNGQAGRIKLTLTPDPKPINDAVEHAIAVQSLPYSTSGDLTHATAASGERVCGYTAGRSVWYRYAATEQTVLQLTGSTSSGGYAEIYDSNLDSVDCGYLGASGGGYGVAGLVVPGEYLVQIAVDNYYEPGSFEFTLDAVPLPANDDFDDASILTAGTPVSQTVAGATMEPGEPVCGYSEETVWFSFTPPTNGNYLVNTSGTNFTPYIGVYTVGPAGLTQVSCSQSPFLGNRPTSIPGQAGREYLIQVGREDYGSFNGTNLTLNVGAAPA